MTPPTTIICYHFPCWDGIYAALCAHAALSAPPTQAEAALSSSNPRTLTPPPLRYVPLTVTRAPLLADLGPLTGDETVYFLDYTGPPGFAISVANALRSTEHGQGRVVVLDHHKTAMEDLMGPEALAARPPNLDVTFDMNRCGASIARDYFRPPLTPQVETMIAMVEDGDLWRWRLPDSKAFYAYLR